MIYPTPNSLQMKYKYKKLPRNRDMDNELTVILYCARIYLNTCSSEILTQFLSSKNIDWNKLIDDALSHKLLYFTNNILKKHARDMVPKDIAEKMKTLCFANSIRTLTQGAELIKVFRLFEKNKIPALPFKGPILSQMIYQTQDARIFNDLDILVPKEDAITARNLLMDNGFHINVQIPASQESAYLQKGNFFHLFDPSGSVNIDLHWEISGRYTIKPVFFQKFTKKNSIMLCGQSFPSMGYEDTLIYICIHGTKNCWDKLEMLFSIAVIVRLYAHTIVWKNLLKKVQVLGISKMLLMGLELARFLFHVPLPDPIEKKMTPHEIRTLFSYLPIKIDSLKNLSFMKTNSLRFSPFHFLIRDNMFDALTYAGRLLFQPTIKEWQTCPLADRRLLFLYHLIRPCRLIKEGRKAILYRKNPIN